MTYEAVCESVTYEAVFAYSVTDELCARVIYEAVCASVTYEAV